MEIEYRYSKSTLMRQRKEELVNYIQCLESNNNVLWEIIENQTKMLEALYEFNKDDLKN